MATAFILMAANWALLLILIISFKAFLDVSFRKGGK